MHLCSYRAFDGVSYKINFVYLKREFDTYVDGLSKDDDKKAEVA